MFKLPIYLSLGILIGIASQASAQTICVKPLVIADTGLDPSGSDLGRQITLKAGAGEGQEGWYGLVDFGEPGGGAEEFRQAIESCAGISVQIGDTLLQESGNMVGPTKQGFESLIGQDPSAYWDTANQCPVSSNRTGSPRVVAIPLFDPAHYLATGELRVTRFVAIFVEAVLGGKDVIGRLTTPNRTCVVTEPNGEVTCGDRFDNDGDGLTDLEDPDCAPG